MNLLKKRDELSAKNERFVKQLKNGQVELDQLRLENKEFKRDLVPSELTQGRREEGDRVRASEADRAEEVQRQARVRHPPAEEPAVRNEQPNPEEERRHRTERLTRRRWRTGQLRSC